MGKELGLDLWIKRDDLTGFAGGGNKGRKIEYLLADVLRQEADTVITCGSSQSNFVRQLAAACSMHGLRLRAVTMDVPYDGPVGLPTGTRLVSNGGNLMLDDLLGAQVDILPDGTWDELFEAVEAAADEERSAGRKVATIPIGGSSPVGAFGFVQAAAELDQSFDTIVVATSSGSTHTGLAYAFHGTSTRVIGVSCDPEPGLVAETLVPLAEGLDQITGQNKGLRECDFEYWLDWVGPGYAVFSDDGMAAIHRMARAEGIFLDPVYSAKSFAGLVGLAERGELHGRVLFWHTGGFPSLFAMPKADGLSPTA
jgi:1-aminocyclopropane-1-carboxylate deaminase/D-cysteine desulfhydrase-like pyridoxal-dependent ACC family enzyme